MFTFKAVDLTESKQSELRALLITMTVLPTVVILIRAWSRALLPVSPMTRIPTRFWWDDWTAFVAAAINIVVCGLALKLVDLGLGLHVQAIPLQNVKKLLKLLWVIYYVFSVGMAVSKTSALLFYTRVFTLSNSKFKYALWSVHAMNVAWLIGTLLSVTFICNPIEKVWNFTLPGTCLNFKHLWLGNGLPNLIIDVIILVLPLPMLWKLQMKTTRRIQISGVFVCGYLVVVVSIGRLVTSVQASTQLQLDPTYQMSTPTMWLGSEIAISLISISLPSVFFLAQRMNIKGVWSLLTSRTHTSHTQASSSGHPVSRYHSNEKDNYGLVSRAQNRSYLPHTRTTAEFVGETEDMENTRHDGIRVVHKTEVV